MMAWSEPTQRNSQRKLFLGYNKRLSSTNKTIMLMHTNYTQFQFEITKSEQIKATKKGARERKIENTYAKSGMLAKSQRFSTVNSNIGIIYSVR